MVTISPLMADEARLLHEAQERLRRGDAAGAGEAIGPLLARNPRHPDLLALHGLACRRSGRLEEAHAAFEEALRWSPERADLWSSYGNLLREMGRGEESLTALEKAVALSPLDANAWMNLGIAATHAGDHGRALEALGRAVRLAPESAAILSALGHAEQQAGMLDLAAEHLRHALSLEPRRLSARHNLAITLRRLDQAEAALAETERAITDGLAAPQTLCTRAHLLADLGRFDDAVAQYRALLVDHPDYLDGQEVLARLLPQLGRGEEALDGYRRALAERPDARALWYSALETARDLKDAGQLLRWAGEAGRRLGADPEIRIFEALGHGMGADSASALAILEPLASRGMAAALGHAAYFRLGRGDLRAAEAHALAATRLAPHVQSAWAYLTVIWRLLADPREAWLADYERLVMPIAVEPPPGFREPAHFIAALEEALTDMHRAKAPPADQSLRGGTQTRGNLFDRQSAVVRALSEAVRRQVADRLAALPTDAAHPFLSRNSGRIAFTGSWSVRLADGGFHINHIHQSGWLSSALYVALPPEIGAAPPPQAPPPGSLIFGVPDAALGIDLEPRRIELPEPGKLVVFPSYFWHGTVPFRSESPRLTIAFDAAPA